MFIIVGGQSETGMVRDKGMERLPEVNHEQFYMTEG